LLLELVSCVEVPKPPPSFRSDDSDSLEGGLLLALALVFVLLDWDKCKTEGALEEPDGELLSLESSCTIWILVLPSGNA